MSLGKVRRALCLSGEFVGVMGWEDHFDDIYLTILSWPNWEGKNPHVGL